MATEQGESNRPNEEDFLRRGDPRFRSMHLWFLVYWIFWPVILVFYIITSGMSIAIDSQKPSPKL